MSIPRRPVTLPSLLSDSTSVTIERKSDILAFNVDDGVPERIISSFLFEYVVFCIYFTSKTMLCQVAIIDINIRYLNQGYRVCDSCEIFDFCHRTNNIIIKRA